MLLRRLLTLSSLVLLSSACRDQPQSAQRGSASAVPVVPDVPVSTPVNPGWSDSTAGPVLLLSSPEAPTATSVVLPMLTDSAIASATVHLLNHLDGMHVDLFGPGGRAGTATLTIVNQTRLVEECPDWPTGTLTNFSGGSWKVGLERDRAAALPLDSLEAMNRQDSAEVTIELARLASRYAVQGAQGEDSAFRGLPFAVRKAYRFRLGDRSVIVGDIVRRVNQEANPLAEHVLIVAERVESATGAAYVVGYHARAAGSEDAVRTTEILAAVRMSQGDRAAIVLSYGYEEGSRVSLLERAGAGMWRMRWRSAYTGC